jgi:hypothetical protein
VPILGHSRPEMMAMGRWARRVGIEERKKNGGTVPNE